MKNKKEKSDKIIRKHVYASMSVGLIPIPLVDFAAASVIQLNMLMEIASLYETSLIDNKKKLKSWIKVLASFTDDALIFVGGKTLSTSISGRMLASFSKFIPGVGQTAGVVTAPILNGTFTYAVGRVFDRHFQSGGTFLTFDPEKEKEYYQEMLSEGKHFAEQIKKSEGE